MRAVPVALDESRFAGEAWLPSYPGQWAMDHPAWLAFAEERGIGRSAAEWAVYRLAEAGLIEVVWPLTDQHLPPEVRGRGYIEQAARYRGGRPPTVTSWDLFEQGRCIRIRGTLELWDWARSTSSARPGRVAPEIDTTPAYPEPPSPLVEAAVRAIPPILGAVSVSPKGTIELLAAMLATRLQTAGHNPAAAQWAIHEAIRAGRLQPGRVMAGRPAIYHPSGVPGIPGTMSLGGSGMKVIPKGRPAPFDCFNVVVGRESLSEWWQSLSSPVPAEEGRPRPRAGDATRTPAGPPAVEGGPPPPRTLALGELRDALAQLRRDEQYQGPFLTGGNPSPFDDAYARVAYAVALATHRRELDQSAGYQELRSFTYREWGSDLTPETAERLAGELIRLGRAADAREAESLLLPEVVHRLDKGVPVTPPRPQKAGGRPPIGMANSPDAKIKAQIQQLVAAAIKDHPEIDSPAGLYTYFKDKRDFRELANKTADRFTTKLFRNTLKRLRRAPRSRPQQKPGP